MELNTRDSLTNERTENITYIPLKDLTLTSHFLFGEVMSDPETCRTALEIMLGKTISKVTFCGTERQIEVHPLYKGIRLDVCFEDEEDTIYSVEIQNANRYHIPRRSRHYQSMVDVKIMPKGERDYRKLQDGIVIFICTFDLFGRGRYCYTFENRCLEERELPLGDGTRKVFLNTKGGNDGETSRELIEFLHCIEYTNEIQPESGKVQRILKRVQQVKQDTEVEGRYMTTMRLMNEMKAEGREQEAERYSAMTLALLDQQRYADLEKAAKDSAFRNQMYQELGIE